MSGPNWGYAINQWDCPRREQQERAFKTISVCGFTGVELRFGSGRWSPLGKPDLIALNFGSVGGLKDFAQSCGIQIASYYYDPLTALEGEDPEYWRGGPAPRSALKRDDHERLVAAAANFAGLVAELGGSCLVLPPVPSFWTTGPLTQEMISVAAEGWNKVGRTTLESCGVRTALHVDCLSGIRTPEQIDALMSLTDSRYVFLALDTAELTVVGMDPLRIYEKHHKRVTHFHFKDTRFVDEGGEFQKPFAEHALLEAGGERGIERWFFEMGTDGGLVDFPALASAIKVNGFDGWIMVESDQSPNPSETALLNSWYVKSVLAKII